MSLAGAVAMALAGCGGMDVAPTSSVTVSVAPTTQEPASTTPTPIVNVTSGPTVSSRPTGTPLPFLPDLDADKDKQQLINSLGFTCRDGDGTDQRMWTCSYRNEVDISEYGPSPRNVSAMRVATDARKEVNRRSWIRGYASIFRVDVWEWAESHFGSNDAARVGNVWVQMTHDANSDGVLISTRHVGP